MKDGFNVHGHDSSEYELFNYSTRRTGYFVDDDLTIYTDFTLGIMDLDEKIIYVDVRSANIPI